MMPSLLDYTVGWISALHEELAAATAMLDATHPRLPQPSTDPNTYTLGSILGYNVVIACLPSGNYGTNAAAAVVSQMRSTFPNIEYVLMVGIGGGVPSSTHDIRLGDVVVSKPVGTYGGVVQYDLGRAIAGRPFQLTGTLNQPPYALLTRIAYLQADRVGAHVNPLAAVVAERLDTGLDRTGMFQRPGPDTDLLFLSTYDHAEPANPSCAQCDVQRLITRVSRPSVDPEVHYGLIGSGNQVIKNGRVRDELAAHCGGLLCFEMEAAGLMNQVPCLVIRGICDYADSHKHKQWQGYAAFVAAAYARLLLSVVTVEARHSQRGGVELNKEISPEGKEFLKGLFVTDPAEDRNALTRRKGARAPGTCEWILETDEFKHWLGTESSDTDVGNILWLHGNPGTGKSTTVIAITEELPRRVPFLTGQNGLAYFFCDSSSDTRRTAEGILRSLLYQLVQERPELIKHPLARYQVQGDRLFTSFDGLWMTLTEIGNDDVLASQYCIIDALDECDSNSQQMLMDQIRQTYHSSNRPHPRIRFLITSRPYPELREKLDEFKNKDLGSYRETGDDLKIYIEHQVKELARTKRYTRDIAHSVSTILRERAEGTFLWVGLACSELASVKLKDTLRRLRAFPVGLYKLYQNMLDSALEEDGADSNVILKVLATVAIARRPLRISDLADACEFFEKEPVEDRLAFVKENIEMCRLLVLFQDDIVRLLHKSVKDFLTGPREKSPINNLQVQGTLATRCLSYIQSSFKSSKRTRRQDEPGIFLEYAVLYWPEHASLAESEFAILDQHRPFFQVDSDEIRFWHDLYKETRIYSRIPDRLTIFYVAAKWGILPLVQYLMASTNKEAQSADAFVFDDAKFAASNGWTPMEEAAMAGEVRVLDILLEAGNTRSLIGTGVLLAAVSNEENGDLQVQTIMKKGAERIKVTPEVVETAARNKVKGTEVMRVLLDMHPNDIEITEGVWIAAAENTGVGASLVDLLLERRGSGSDITEDVIDAAVRNWACAKEVTEIFLDWGGDDIPITESTLEAAARNRVSGERVIRVLLDRCPSALEVTEDVWIAAVQNEASGTNIVALLLEAGYIDVEITVQLLEAIAGNVEDMLEVLFDPRYTRVHITPAAVEDCCGKVSDRLWKLMLDRRVNHGPAPQDSDSEMEDLTMQLRQRARPSGRSATSSPLPEDSRLAKGTTVSFTHTLQSRSPVVKAAFSPGMNLLACIVYPHTDLLWNPVPRARVNPTDPLHTQFPIVARSPDGFRIARVLWETNSILVSHRSRHDSDVTFEGHTDSITALTFSDNGKLVASASCDQTVRVWDVSAGTATHKLYGHPGATPVTITFSSNGRLLASGAKDRAAIIWDLARGRRVQVLYGHYGEITAVAFAPGNDMLASASVNGIIRLWEIKTWSLIRVLRGHTANVIAISFSPDGKYLASTSWDSTVKLWQTGSGSLDRELANLNTYIPSIRFTPDGERLVLAKSYEAVDFWDTSSGRFIRKMDIRWAKGPSTSLFMDQYDFAVWYLDSFEVGYFSDSLRGRDALAFSQDEQCLATSGYGKNVWLWYWRTGDLVILNSGTDSQSGVLRFSPDGKRLASGLLDGTVEVWDLATSKEVALKWHTSEVVEVAFSWDNEILASASLDGTIICGLPCDESPKRCILPPWHHSIGKQVDFSLDCRFAVACSEDGTFYIWDPKNENLRKVSSGSLSPVCVSPDGNTVATCLDDYAIRLWDLSLSVPYPTLEGSRYPIGHIAFSPDSRYVVGAGGETIHVWDVRDQRLVRTLYVGFPEIKALGVSEDGRLLASGLKDATIRVWGIGLFT